jgi:hypothetical protein
MLPRYVNSFTHSIVPDWSEIGAIGVGGDGIMIAFVFEILMSRPTRLAALSTLRSKVSAFSHNRDIVCII